MWLAVPCSATLRFGWPLAIHPNHSTARCILSCSVKCKWSRRLLLHERFCAWHAMGAFWCTQMHGHHTCCTCLCSNYTHSLGCVLEVYLSRSNPQRVIFAVRCQASCSRVLCPLAVITSLLPGCHIRCSARPLPCWLDPCRRHIGCCVAALSLRICVCRMYQACTYVYLRFIGCISDARGSHRSYVDSTTCRSGV